MTPEGKVKAQVRKYLDSRNVYHFMPPGVGVGRAGIPDIICCYKGIFIGIECKAGKGHTTALQERELWRIRTAGGFAMVFSDDQDSMIALINIMDLIDMKAPT